MGSVVRWPLHGWASAAVLKPKIRRSKAMPRRSASSAKTTKYREGMEPEARQLLTAGAVTAATAATAVVPPKASTRASTVSSMPLDNSSILKLSSLQERQIDDSYFLNSARAMSRLDIIYRLNLLQRVLGIPHKDVAAAAKCTPSDWSNWRNPQQNATIPWENALELYLAFGVTMEWIYGGDVRSIADEKLRLAILQAERHAVAKRA